MPEFDLQEKEKTVTKRRTTVDEPSFYKVILLNDDYTTFDFVVSVLTGIFGKSVPEAIAITNDVHRNGNGVCGLYPRDMAETKVEMVAQNSKRAGFPLKCIMEKE